MPNHPNTPSHIPTALSRLAESDRSLADTVAFHDNERLQIINDLCDGFISHNDGVISDQGYFMLAMHGSTEQLSFSERNEFEIEGRSGAHGTKKAEKLHEATRRQFHFLRPTMAPIVQLEDEAVEGLPYQLPQITAIATVPYGSRGASGQLQYHIQRTVENRSNARDRELLRPCYIGSVLVPVVNRVDVRDYDGAAPMTEVSPGSDGSFTVAQFVRRVDSLAATSVELPTSYAVEASAIQAARQLGTAPAAAEGDQRFLARSGLALRLWAQVIEAARAE